MLHTKIEWTDTTWNPVSGCTKISAGCKNCYAELLHERFNGKNSFSKVTAHPTRLFKPIHWKKPRKIFVNSMSDLFHKDVKFEFIDMVFAIIALCPQHTFQILTKRPEIMRDYFSAPKSELIARWESASYVLGLADKNDDTVAPACQIFNYCNNNWPLPNVWLGVSVEDQITADKRIPILQTIDAAVRFISCEPLLGPIDLQLHLYALPPQVHPFDETIHWVIAGGESGPKARPMHPDWIRAIQKTCEKSKVPFFFKQWGEFGHHALPFHSLTHWVNKAQTWLTGWRRGKDKCIDITGLICDSGSNFQEAAYPVYAMRKIGKTKAGNFLDGKQHLNFPNN